mmetsp:Transcript_31114/g.40028  ORF Transcript_31114/g.40028 Transcript_31114/m.40028 type:complete len:590 (+) Transcript_31114:17-1786(+)
MAISAAEQERLWEEAERAEELNMRAASEAKKVATAQITAQVKEEEAQKVLRASVSTNVAAQLGIADQFEFQLAEAAKLGEIKFGGERGDAVILGSGAFGKVLKGRHKVTKQIVAIKQLKKNMMKDNDHKTLKKEVQLLKECGGNPHVLDFIGFYECDDYYDIVTEVAEGGELHDVIVNRTDQLEEVIAKHIAHSLLDAIAHLQDRNIAHRDVKPENILLRDRGELNGNILLCDFGFASKCNGKSLRKNCGSSAYMAPEVIKGDYYDFRCDVWSVGVTIYQMITGNKLFYGSEESIERAVTRCPGFSAEDTGSKILLKKMHPTLLNMSTYAQELLCLCLDPIQERRPLAKDLLNHAWFQNMDTLNPPSVSLQQNNGDVETDNNNDNDVEEKENDESRTQQDTSLDTQDASLDNKDADKKEDDDDVVTGVSNKDDNEVARDETTEVVAKNDSIVYENEYDPTNAFAVDESIFEVKEDTTVKKPPYYDPNAPRAMKTEIKMARIESANVMQETDIAIREALTLIAYGVDGDPNQEQTKEVNEVEEEDQSNRLPKEQDPTSGFYESKANSVPIEEPFPSMLDGAYQYATSFVE